MPMPHRTFAEVAKRRLVGKEGSDRVAAIRALLGELPGYRNGPYADLRKWLEGELDRTRIRAKVVHRDSLQVRREGAAQVALVGPPNAGKSSLLQALSDIQIKTGDYAFTTLRPVPALTRIGGVLVQLVEIPGLIEGAYEDRGGGRALLGVLRNADAIVYCRAANEPAEGLDVVLREVAAAGIEKRAILALTKADELADVALEPAVDSAAFESVVPVSVLDDESLDRLREAVWALTGLIRVRPRRDGHVDDEPFALPAGATVAELADLIHHDVGRSCTGGRVWGASARFDGQRVGRAHVLADADVVEVTTR
jgi:small GTP-binding protein